MASSARGDKNWMKKGKLALNSEKHYLLNIIYEEVKHFFILGNTMTMFMCFNIMPRNEVFNKISFQVPWEESTRDCQTFLSPQGENF